MKKLRQKIYQINCVVCNELYETTSSWSKYCSQACRQKSFRERKNANKSRVVTELHNVVSVLRNNNVTDTCRQCNAKRRLLEQTVNRSLCFDCFPPNWTIISSIKEGLYDENVYINDPLIMSVKNGEWDDFLRDN